MLSILDRERERLHRTANRWGLLDKRTIRQSKKLDKLINSFMVSPVTQRTK